MEQLVRGNLSANVSPPKKSHQKVKGKLKRLKSTVEISQQGGAKSRRNPRTEVINTTEDEARSITRLPTDLLRSHTFGKNRSFRPDPPPILKICYKMFDESQK